MDALEYDVLVVGGGPAGSSAANRAASSGVRVLLIDRRASIGVPVQCAEFIPKLLMREVGTRVRRSIVQSVDEMVTYFPNGDVSRLASPGHILNRTTFDRALVLDAAAQGAHVLTGTRAVAYSEEGVLARQGRRTLQIRANVIVGADGPTSTVGRWMGWRNEEFVIGMQYAVPLLEPMAHTEVHFDRTYPCGYAWLFPKGDVANAGVGVVRRSAREARTALDHFLHDLIEVGKIDGRTVLGFTSGLIPVGGPPERTVDGNMLLAGDAAGQCDPITGAGISAAVICGKMAGEAAARAVRTGDLGRLSRYETEWRRLFGRSLEDARRRREHLEKHWDADDLDDVVRRSWVTSIAHCGLRNAD